jgi:predicted metal-dependent HD superfamily phosphohydrolase
MPDLPTYPGTDINYVRGRDFSLEDQICRIIGVRRFFMTRAKGWYFANSEGRHYHTFDHALDVAAEVIDACLMGYPGPLGNWRTSHLKELVIAAIYHDAVYVAGENGKNEAESAKLAQSEIMDLEIDCNSDYVAQLINETANHFKVVKRDYVDTERAKDRHILMDADIHSFAAPWDIFVDTQEQIFKEFIDAGTPRKDAIDNQNKFLASVLKIDRIFSSQRACQLYEQITRDNITRYLALGNERENV